MKKVVLAIISVFILTGCTAEYNLNIDDNMNEFDESLSVKTSSASSDYDYVKNFNEFKPIDYKITGYSEVNEKMDGVTYYNFDNDYDDDQASFKYYYNMNKSEFLSSAIIHNCFSEINYIKNDDGITLKTNGKFTCFDKYPPLDKVIVNITTNKKVIKNNADSISGNIYTWNIYKGNETNTIMLTFENTENNNINESDDISTKLKIILITLGAFIVVIIGIIIYKTKKYNSN